MRYDDPDTDQYQYAPSDQISRTSPAMQKPAGTGNPHSAEQSCDEADHDTREPDGHLEKRHAQTHCQCVNACRYRQCHERPTSTGVTLRSSSRARPSIEQHLAADDAEQPSRCLRAMSYSWTPSASVALLFFFWNKLILGSSAPRATPIIRQILERRTRRNAAFRVALMRMIAVRAHCAGVPSHISRMGELHGSQTSVYQFSASSSK